jgi:ribosomal-protein-alanine N-acetyltransferase
MEYKVIEGQTIFLRPIQLSDSSGPYLNWLNDPEVNQYLESRFVSWTTEMLSSYIVNLANNNNELLFAICTMESKKHIGNVKLGPINWNHRFADIGIIIGDKCEWGKGRASEAIRAICRYGFDELELNKITAGCYGDNQGSVKAFSRVGFQQEGISRKKFFSSDRYQDHILLGILNDEFKR